MFIQHLATTTHNVVKAERKPRRNIQYRDVASAVAKTDNLEFLVDVVPRTMTFGTFKKKQEARKAAEGVNGQTNTAGPSVGIASLINGNGEAKAAEESKGEVEKQNGHMEEDKEQVEEAAEEMEVDGQEKQVEEPEEPEEEDSVAMQIEMEMRGPRTNVPSPVVERRTSGFTAINGSK